MTACTCCGKEMDPSRPHSSACYARHEAKDCNCYNTYEHWANEDGTSNMLVPSDHPQKQWLAEDMKLSWSVKAADWNEAMTLYYIHMGWDPYKPMEVT